MWKSGKSLRATRTFFPQANVDNFQVFHRACGRKFFVGFSTEIPCTFHKPLWKFFRQNFTPQARGKPYSRLLILAVISRMVFCRSVLPSFSATSILRMLYRAVE